jgi:hypothetical protein
MGAGHLYSAMMPGLQGRQKRTFFNSICVWGIVGAGLAGAVTGGSSFGILGAIAGFLGAFWIGIAFLKRERFYRP